jgi:HK97 gp10 family phage protein
MAEFKIDIEGLEELGRILEGLPEKLARKALREGVRAGAEIMEAEAKALAPVHSPGPSHPKIGHLRDQINVKVSVSRKQTGTEARAALSTGRAYWGRFAEYRHKPYMRPAMDRKSGDAFDETARVMARELPGAVKERG